MMKQLLLAFCVFAGLGLYACGSSEETQSTPTDSKMEKGAPKEAVESALGTLQSQAGFAADKVESYKMQIDSLLNANQAELADGKNKLEFTLGEDGMVHAKVTEKNAEGAGEHMMEKDAHKKDGKKMDKKMMDKKKKHDKKDGKDNM